MNVAFIYYILEKSITLLQRKRK